MLQHPEQTTVYTRPRLIVIEHLVMGLFLAADAVEPEIRRTLSDLEFRCKPEDPRLVQCRGLLYLCTEYCPALVEMGIAVRQCFWKTQDCGTGVHAKSVLRDATVLLHAMRGKTPSEYVRNLCVMQQLWTAIHSELPAATFVEECLESSLSVLTRRHGTDTRATTVQQISDLYRQDCV